MLYFRTDRNGNIKQSVYITNNPDHHIIHYFAGEVRHFDVDYDNATRVLDSKEIAEIINEYRSNGYVFRNYALAYRDRSKAGEEKRAAQRL